MRLPDGFHIDNPAFPLLQALITYWGTTTVAGNVAGTTVRCGNLANEPPYDNHALKLLDGPSAGQVRDITLHPAGTDTLTVANAFVDPTGAASQVAAGLRFVIISHSPTTAELAALQIIAEQILAFVNAMLRLMETDGSVTLDGNEQDLYRVETPAGVFDPKKVMIDMSLQTAAETVVVRVYYRIVLGGALVLKDRVTYAGAQDPPLINVELEPNRFGIRVSIERTAGGAIAYPWAAFYGLGM